MDASFIINTAAHWEDLLNKLIIYVIHTRILMRVVGLLQEQRKLSSR